jgi:hypothetical protein
LLNHIKNRWHGCLSITDTKNFWTKRHYDHHTPPGPGLAQGRL